MHHIRTAGLEHDDCDHDTSVEVNTSSSDSGDRIGC